MLIVAKCVFISEANYFFAVLLAGNTISAYKPHYTIKLNKASTQI